MNTLRNQLLSDFDMADVNDLPVVPPDRWIVLSGRQWPVTAIAPATRLDPRPPPRDRRRPRRSRPERRAVLGGLYRGQPTSAQWS